ncbi:MAG: thioredoxin-dependent thiol peroxidase [Candidatus Eisenbacteria bacterium]|nr:thioredoxin-dependent thiol peroxidase [Candidatus Latescibacterota bacterium]MBD3300936.1 thioredoxin-dependent thiol peroxidase [Candidatus Eisenbacteria bacterium]
MLEAGDRAPDFTAETTGGKSASLKDFRGKTVVLYFYPKDNTPGCTREACAFRDNLSRIKRKNTVVLGVSPDSVASHDRFTEKHELTFPLISDPDHAIAEAYGVWVEKNRYGKKSMGIQRSTFIIDEKGKIKAVFPKVKVDGHVDEVLEAL